MRTIGQLHQNVQLVLLSTTTATTLGQLLVSLEANNVRMTIHLLHHLNLIHGQLHHLLLLYQQSLQCIFATGIDVTHGEHERVTALVQQFDDSVRLTVDLQCWWHVNGEIIVVEGAHGIQVINVPSISAATTVTSTTGGIEGCCLQFVKLLIQFGQVGCNGLLKSINVHDSPGFVVVGVGDVCDFFVFVVAALCDVCFFLNVANDQVDKKSGEDWTSVASNP